MKLLTLLAIILFADNTFAQTKRARDVGVLIGVLPTGKFNSIADVTGVKVGHTTLVIGDSP